MDFEIKYLGNLRTKMKHLASGSEIFTDAPVDNCGKGEFFSPTDLVASSLASCMLTIIGIFAERMNFSIEGTRAEVKKIMATEPRRISEIIIDLYFPDYPYTEKEKQIIHQCIKTCPVAKSLNPEIKQTVNCHFQS